MEKSLERICTISSLSSLLGVSRPTVYIWERDGVLRSNGLNPIDGYNNGRKYYIISNYKTLRKNFRLPLKKETK